MDNNKNIIIKKEFAGEAPGHIADAKYFYFEKAKREKTDLSILCGGYEKCASDFKLNRKHFPFFAIIYTISGKGSFKYKSKTHELRRGSLSAFSPNEPYVYTTDVDDPMEQIFLIFVGEKADELLVKSGLDKKGAIKVLNPEAIFNNLKQILDNGISEGEYSQEICCNYLWAILLEQASEKGYQSVEGTSFESFERCRKYLESNFTNINSSSQLADNCCLNVRYVARLFRKYSEMRPYDYLISLKLNKAANLLITTNFNVNQISTMSGIDDAYHFSRIFKKKFNVPPSEYRRGLTAYMTKA